MFKLMLLALSTVAVAWGQHYHAKIVVEGGGPPPGPPVIHAFGCSDLVIFGNGTIEFRATRSSCSVLIRLEGYQLTSATLEDGKTIVLKRIGDHEGSMLSMTSLKAPEDARKAFERGAEQIYRRKWSAAQKDLERAVGLYPQYAQAWSNLGEALRAQSKPSEARAAFEKAIAADPAYLRPYQQLAKLDLDEGRMEDAARISATALVSKPIDMPGLYFYNAVANFNLKRLAEAEKSARMAVEIDSALEIPRAENLLGNILAAKGDIPGAIQHLRRYLEHSPRAADAAEVKRQIEKLERTP